MKISGFTMVKNATKLYYPIRESIESILPIVDEFVVALGDCDEDDETLKEIKAIQSDKIRIIHTIWDLDKYPNGTENAHQTNLAREACSGDWLFYVQADEVVHEQFHDEIVQTCQRHLSDKKVEGILFNYTHFWGDYNHYQDGHGWYKHEIRIVRNHPDIYSWESAQSFRRIPNFDQKNYRQQEGTYKLNVVKTKAHIYHYGWVRPPRFMQSKKKSLDTIHKGKAQADKNYEQRASSYNYGPLGRAQKFNHSHPIVMQRWLDKFDWQDELNYSSKELDSNRELHKHDMFKYRVITWIEQKLLGGRPLGGFQNYVLLKDK